MWTSRETREPKSVWTVVNGRQMHARVAEGAVPAGSPAVVLVHGLVVSSRYMVPTLERMAPFYRVYAPDLPGFGRSEKPPRVLDVSGLSDALAGWMRATGLENAALVGNSMGCQVIADLAVRHPGLVGRAVLQGPTMDPDARFAMGQTARLLLDFTREPPSLFAVMLLDLLDAGFFRATRTFRYSLEDRIEDRLPRMRVPTLVVRGSRDPIAPQSWAEKAARLLPEGRLAVIPRATHTANYGSSAEFARVIRSFLEGDREAGEEAR